MSIAKFYPFNGKRGRLRLGLGSIALSEWLQYEDDFVSRVQQKKQLVQTQRSKVLQAPPKSIDAQKEFLDLFLAHLKKYHTKYFEILDESIVSKLDDTKYFFSDYLTCPLELISYLIGDDICLLREGNQDYSLVAASVCAPTWWDLQEKMGKPLTDIHAPIANLEEKIGRMIRHFLKNLKVGDCFQRANWFLFTRPDYCVFPNSFDFNADMKSIDINNIEQKLYLRSERQTFRKLKSSKHIIFAIKVYVEPISMLKDNPLIAQDLTLSLQIMGVEQKHALGIDLIEKPLMSYLENCINFN